MDKPTIKPGNPGSARVEYYACREEVEAMLAQGYTARFVHTHMIEQGRVTCSYSAFCDYVRGGGKRQHSKKGKKAFKGFSMPERSTPILAGKSKSGFMHPSEVDTRDLF